MIRDSGRGVVFMDKPESMQWRRLRGHAPAVLSDFERSVWVHVCKSIATNGELPRDRYIGTEIELDEAAEQTLGGDAYGEEEGMARRKQVLDAISRGSAFEFKVREGLYKEKGKRRKINTVILAQPWVITSKVFSKTSGPLWVILIASHDWAEITNRPDFEKYLPSPAPPPLPEVTP